jgi:hypothetical protein
MGLRDWIQRTREAMSGMEEAAADARICAFAMKIGDLQPGAIRNAEEQHAFAERFREAARDRGGRLEMDPIEAEMDAAVEAGQIAVDPDGQLLRDGGFYDLGRLKEQRLEAAQALGSTLRGLEPEDSEGPSESLADEAMAAQIEHLRAPQPAAEPPAYDAGYDLSTEPTDDDDDRRADHRMDMEM